MHHGSQRTSESAVAWKVGLALLGPIFALGGCYDGVEVPADGDDPDAVTATAGETDPDEMDSEGDSDGDDNSAELDGPEECVDTQNFFEEQVWGPILQADCFGCHNPTGAAKNTDFVLQGNDYPGYLDANYNTLKNIAKLEIEGTPLVLLKPSAQVEHGGAARFPIDGEAYEAMAEMVERFGAPVHCVNDDDINAYFTGIVELDEEQTLRKATFLLASRFPTPDEYDAVRGEGIDSLDAVLDEVLAEEAFYVRLREVFNDMLHTDAALVGDTAIDALDMERFPEARWYDLLPEEQIDEARDRTNDAIAREPLHIIEHIVREGRPFSEVLTADYTLVNPFSARAYGLDLSMFEDQNDPEELVEYSFEDIPQAGVMTTPAFLDRYPSTPTNRNRHRSRVIFDFFFATNVMRLAARPIDVSSIADFNPTLYNPQCNVCHDNIDPLAGAFQNWTDEGWYRPPATGWHLDMLPPGFGELEIPYEENERALGWLAAELVKDPKFALAVVHTMYTGLTGQEPLLEPLDADQPDYVQQIKAFEAQDYTFKRIADRFRDGGDDVRVVIKELVKTPWFRAVGLETQPDNDRALELRPMGTARLLSPEALHRKVEASVGFPWQRNGTNVLLSSAYYLFFYGGIDSSTVTTRLDAMNGVMVNIAERMANEVSCYATSYDFTRPGEERLLFPNVEVTDLPDNGGREKIINNIIYLHQHLLGETRDDEDPEVLRTLALFEGVLNDGRNDLLSESPEYSTALEGACRATIDRVSGDDLPEGDQLIDDPDYTIRAWMAVTSYLLGDYRFLYE